MTRIINITACTALTLAPAAHAQSLFLAPQEVAQGEDRGEVAVQSLSGVSMFVVVPPEPRLFQKHDIVEIIINESTDFRVEQSLETEKTYDLRGVLAEFPSLRNLVELQLRNGDTTPIVVVDAAMDKEFSGDGQRETRDYLTSRIAATILEIKPNGNLVLEAKEVVSADGEVKTMVLSGVCSEEDVTEENTVLSSRIANLTISLSHEGDVNDAAKKGLIARVLDSIFAF